MPYNFVNRWLCKYVHLMLTSESEEYPLKTKINMRTLTTSQTFKKRRYFLVSTPLAVNYKLGRCGKAVTFKKSVHHYHLTTTTTTTTTIAVFG